MRFRDQMAVTLLVQGGGAIAALGAIVLLGAALGPAAQGLFSRTKAEVEFVGALAMMGLPQALFYFVRCARLTPRSALVFTAAAAMLGAASAVAYARLAHSWGWLESLSFALAVGLFALHGNLRSLVLALRSTLWFNAVTAVPQLLIVASVLILIVLGDLDGQRSAIALAVSFGMAATFAGGLLTVHGQGALEEGESVGPARVLGYGVASWTSAAAAGLSVVLIMRIVEARIGPGALGVFSAALVVMQMLLTPLNYAAPLLFRRWLDSPEARAPMLMACTAAASILVVALLVHLVPWPDAAIALLGPYSDLRLLVGWMLVAASAEAMTRILNVAANAAGRPWVPAGAELVRLFTLIAAAMFLTTTSIQAFAVVWAASAVAASLFVVTLHRMRRLVSRVGR